MNDEQFTQKNSVKQKMLKLSVKTFLKQNCRIANYIS